MNRVVFISTLMLILIFRQTSPVPLISYNLGDHVVIQKNNIINNTHGLGLGWIEDRDTSNQKEIAPRIEPFRMEEHSLADAKSKGCVKFSFQCRSNPFLIDLPPPACIA